MFPKKDVYVFSSASFVRFLFSNHAGCKTKKCNQITYNVKYPPIPFVYTKECTTFIPILNLF